MMLLKKNKEEVRRERDKNYKRKKGDKMMFDIN